MPAPRPAPRAAFPAPAWLALSLTLPLALGLAACNSKSEGIAGPARPLPSSLRFTEVHQEAGIDFVHTINLVRAENQTVAAGAAAGDLDGDGHVDLFVIGGDTFGNLLYRNRGDGTFEEIGEAAGIRLLGGVWSGAMFADFDGDGRDDLFLAGRGDTLPCLLHNEGDGTFADATPGSGLDAIRSETLCAAFGDYDRDGDLDLFLTHWGVVRKKDEPSQHLWRNDGAGRFTDVSLTAGVTAVLIGPAATSADRSFTPNFTDIDNDGWPDLLITGDQGGNRALINDQKGGFYSLPNLDLVSDHASGAAIGDYDNDGDLDWFVSGVFHPASVTTTGNRFYQNQGNGTFLDQTTATGVREGGWGWGASFADFDNNGLSDLVQVNGFGTSATGNWGEFYRDPSRLFLANGDGTFTDRAAQVGFDDALIGRGVLCFDYDRDGDVDIFVINSLGQPHLWRNEGGNARNHLTVQLRYLPGNLHGIGARIRVITGSQVQIRELRCGTNFASQQPPEAHFGLGAFNRVDRVEVTWPDGITTAVENAAVNRLLRIER